MLGNQTLENQTDYSIYSGKLAKQTADATVCATLRTDDLDFLSWLPARPLTKQQYLRMLDLVYCPNLDPTQRRCLQTKLYQYRLTIHSSLNQSRMGWTVQKQNSHTGFPPQNSQEGNLTPTRYQKKSSGLDTTVDWKNTGDNSYDGEKLKLLVHDESGKWERPTNILNNWRVTKTCLRLGSRVIGKCMMGSTSNALDKGGKNFKKLYDSSDVASRNKNGQTKKRVV